MKLFQKQCRLTHAELPDTVRRNNVQISSVRTARRSESTFHVEKRNSSKSFRGLSQRTGANGCQKKELKEIRSRFQANSMRTKKICEILSQASKEQPRPQHRQPCQCTATHRTLPKGKHCGYLSLCTTEGSTKSTPSRTPSTLSMN